MAGGMLSSIITHPVAMFSAGMVFAVGGLAVILAACAAPNRTAEAVDDYRRELARAGTFGPAAGSPAEKAALERFTAFLQGINDPDFIRENTANTYAADAYLNDTLVTHRGAAGIESYFLKTSAAMTDYKVTIDDIARSGDDHYVRWTMIFAAPALSGGQPVHSVGISQVRFDADGRVAFHQDFWDSGENFFGRAPVAGGIIGFIRKRLE
jgi:hypothetical protein